MNTDYESRMLRAYEELHRAILCYMQNNYPTTLFPMKGKHYGEDDFRFMLIGRAVNGWKKGRICSESGREYAEGALGAIRNANRFTEDWDDPTIAGVQHTPFWRSGQMIFHALWQSNVERAIPTSWYEHIVWANLYPVAYSAGGNPPEKMMDAQREAAKVLLADSIELFRPSHILFETGWNGWFQYGKEKCCFIDESKFAPEPCFAVHSETDMVKWKGTFRFCETRSFAVVAGRPEFKALSKNDGSGYTDLVIQAFQELARKTGKAS